MEFLSSCGRMPQDPAPTLRGTSEMTMLSNLPDSPPPPRPSQWLPGLETFIGNRPPTSLPLEMRKWGTPRKGKWAAPFWGHERFNNFC